VDYNVQRSTVYILLGIRDSEAGFMSCIYAWPDRLDVQDPVTAEKGQEEIDLRGTTWRNVRGKCPWGENGVLQRPQGPISREACRDTRFAKWSR
jgi:hypothetical protein